MEKQTWKFEFEEAAYDKVNEELKWRLLHERKEAFFVVENVEHQNTGCWCLRLPFVMIVCTTHVFACPNSNLTTMSRHISVMTGMESICIFLGRRNKKKD
jgi:hypothetical protein